MSNSILSEATKELAKECNEKHVKVIQAVLSGEFDSNAAAYQSIYKESSDDTARTNCPRVLAIACNRALYNQLKEESLEEGVMSRAEAMKRLTDMVRTDMSDLITFGSRTFETLDKETGEPKEVTVGTWNFKDSDELTPEAIAAISEIASSKEGVKLKIHDAKAAIKLLADMAGWNKATEVDLTHKGLPQVNIYLPDNGRSE